MARPFVIVSASRSGTNYLLSAFAAVFPDAIVLREVFRKGSDSLPEIEALTGLGAAEARRMATEDPVALWNEIDLAAREAGRPLALKVFYYHQPKDSPLWPRLAAEARVVHLVRRRILDTYVSLKRAEASGEWMRVGGAAPAAVPPITIDAEDLRRFIALRERYAAEAEARFAGADFHRLAYEDIADSAESAAAAVARLAGGRLPRAVDLPIRRQNTQPLRETVANYDEIAEYDRLYL